MVVLPPNARVIDERPNNDADVTKSKSSNPTTAECNSPVLHNEMIVAAIIAIWQAAKPMPP